MLKVHKLFPVSFLNTGLRERRHHHLSKTKPQNWKGLGTQSLIQPFCFIDESTHRLGKLKGCACIYTDEECQDLFLNKRSLVCRVRSRSVVSDSFATPWTVAHQAPLSMGILQTRILEWVAMPSSSRGTSQPRDLTKVSNIAGGLYYLSHQEESWKPSNPSRDRGAPGKEDL